MKILEIVCLENGDVVLVEATGDAEVDVRDVSDVPVTESRRVGDADQPLVSIRFSPEVRDMLGDDSLGVAEAMIEAATAYISDETGFESSDFSLDQDLGQGSELHTDRVDPDLDDFEDQVSTARVVLH